MSGAEDGQRGRDALALLLAEWTPGEVAAFRIGLMHAAALVQLEADLGGSAERAASRVLRQAERVGR